MFTILGSDGKQYGPVPADKVQAWMRDGRANLQTKAQRQGEAEWRTLGEFAEFSATPPPPPVEADRPTPAATFAEAAAPGLADRFVRLGAVILDNVIAISCAAPGLLVLGMSFLRAVLVVSRGGEPDFSEIEVFHLVLGLILLGVGGLGLLIVQVWLLATRGQTIGKKLLKIRIVREPGHAAAGFVHAWLLRNFVTGFIRAVPWIGFVFTLVDVCFIFRDDRRCLHDLIAGTKVVQAE